MGCCGPVRTADFRPPVVEDAHRVSAPSERPRLRAVARRKFPLFVGRGLAWQGFSYVSPFSSRVLLAAFYESTFACSNVKALPGSSTLFVFNGLPLAGPPGRSTPLFAPVARSLGPIFHRFHTETYMGCFRPDFPPAARDRS